MSGDPSTRASAPSSKKQKRTKRQQVAPHRPKPSVDSDEQEWFHKFTQGDPLYAEYMTNEWGREKDTDSELFEKLSLEGAQSGLSWRTILHKREAYRTAFHGFDIDKVAAMTEGEIDALMSKTADDPKELVVRHRGKLASVLNNAQIIQQLIADGTIDSFKEYLWSFVDRKPILNRWASFHDLPSKTEESERMSKELKKRGFKFVGPTTCYAMMQSCGFVIDHPVGTTHWVAAEERLKGRNGGYQVR
ncbi:hypothetical protein ACHAXT_007264 [Thalassiosira profunda]